MTEMEKKNFVLVSVLIVLLISAVSFAVECWTFDSLDELAGGTDQVHGSFYRLVDGAVGKGLELDGNSSYVERTAGDAPKITGDFSVAGWIALGAYPTNWCPIADQSEAADKGYFLGIDALGRAGFKVKTGEKWCEAVDETKIPLRKWVHVAGVYSSREGLKLYLNGKEVAAKKCEGKFEPASGTQMLIGRPSVKRKPYGAIRPFGTADVYTFFDGIIDDLRIYDGAVSAEELGKYYENHKPSAGPPLAQRKLPAGPMKAGKFGAIYTTLKYYDAWDAIWRVGEHADVVVRFDKSPCKFVFWRGTSYIPHWVTENEIWYDNEFNEAWSGKGCHEPMSDKRCEHSHARIIESNPARVVVHWRYALVDNWYNMIYVDDITGWGDWTDEVYTIYPDQVAVRKITLHSSRLKEPHQWHEAIIVMSPGQRPEQVLHTEALELANMTGQTHTYSWAEGAPGKDGYATEPKGANIHLVNTRSEYKPFAIMRPQSNPVIDIYSHEHRRDVSIFPWWNHWPTAQKPSDGRYAQDSDMASHCSLSHGNWDAYSVTNNSMTKILLNGLTKKTAGELVPLAGSWSYPAGLELSENKGDFVNEGYDPTERAYQLVCKRPGGVSKLGFKLKASKASPVINPCFVVKSWGQGRVGVKMNGRKLEKADGYRAGYRDSLEGTDLIIWIQAESDETVGVEISKTD